MVFAFLTASYFDFLFERYFWHTDRFLFSFQHVRDIVPLASGHHCFFEKMAIIQAVHSYIMYLLSVAAFKILYFWFQQFDHDVPKCGFRCIYMFAELLGFVSWCFTKSGNILGILSGIIFFFLTLSSLLLGLNYKCVRLFEFASIGIIHVSLLFLPVPLINLFSHLSSEFFILDKNEMWLSVLAFPFDSLLFSIKCEFSLLQLSS